MTGQMLIDTSAFIALFHRQDQYHQAAVRYWQTHRGSPRVTSIFIIQEPYILLRYRAGTKLTSSFLEAIEESTKTGLQRVLWGESDWTPRIPAILAQYADQDLSYTDAISLLICRDIATVTRVFAFDHHLGLTGLPVEPYEL